MAIFLREADVEKLVTMDMAIETMEQVFRLQGEFKVENVPRRRSRLNKGILHVMSASLPTLGYAGFKSYASVSGKPSFYVTLYGADGTIVAVMEADKLGQMRTGATTAVATKYMARRESSRMGVFGTGWQARAQVQALCTVGSFRNIVAWSRNPENRAKFCEEMTEATGVPVIPAEAPEEAAKEKDIIITATNCEEPVLKGEWLSEGTHINAIGSNFLDRQELDVEAVRKSSCIIVDSSEQAMLESGDLAKAAEAEAFYWEDARELGLVVIGEYPGREDPSEITLFESQGIAMEDVALAAQIYEKAAAEEMGELLPMK